MLDDYLKVQVLPSVLCATDPESKYTVLVDGIYNSIAQCFGNMISHHNDFKNSKERRIEIRLLNVRMLKKECRRQYHRALRECWDPEALAALSRNWFKLIRQHNHLRLRLVKKQVWNKTKELQQKCDKNFWGFVSSDKSNSPNVSNYLDMKTVTAHFTETYSSENAHFQRPPTFHFQLFHLLRILFLFRKYGNQSRSQEYCHLHLQ